MSERWLRALRTDILSQWLLFLFNLHPNSPQSFSLIRFTSSPSASMFSLSSPSLMRHCSSPCQFPYDVTVCFILLLLFCPLTLVKGTKSAVHPIDLELHIPWFCSARRYMLTSISILFMSVAFVQGSFEAHHLKILLCYRTSEPWISHHSGSIKWGHDKAVWLMALQQCLQSFIQ